MSVLAKHTWKILKDSLTNELKDLGFTQVKGTQFTWCEPFKDGYLTLYFWINKYGWMDEIGSSFTLDFDFRPEPQSGNSAFTKRYYDLINTDSYSHMLQANTNIKSYWPCIEQDNEELAFIRNLQDSFVFDPNASKNKDFWMHYYTEDHVSFWAEFIKEQLKDLIQEYKEYLWLILKP